MAYKKILFRRDPASSWTSTNPTLSSGEIGYETDTGKFKIGNGSTAWTSLSYANANLSAASLDALSDVTITSAANGDFLRWNGTAWINDAVNLSTDTVGNYVESLVAGTGVTLTNNSGEAATPTVSIGQAVGTSSSVTFANVTAPLTGNASTASALQTARTISLSGDVSGSVSFNGSSNVDITATVQPNSVALGTDTSGDYVSSLVAGTGIALTNNSGESATPTVALNATINNLSDVTIASAVTYNIGDTGPAGGKIFLTPSSVGNATGEYFEVAPAISQVQRTGATGANAGYLPAILVSGAGGTAIGTGEQNTIDIGNQSGNVAASCAAVYCSEYTYGGFSDWFLPSKDELVDMRSKNVLIGGFESAYYWSSSEDESNPSTATFWSVNFGGAGQTNNEFSKDNSFWVRPIRSFTAPTGVQSGDFLKYDGAEWVNDPINLGTDTVGSFVESLVAGTGVTLSNNSGEGATPTVAIGQAVGTSSSVTFARVETTGNAVIGGNLTVNGTTTTLNTETLAVEDNIVVLNSNVTGSPTLNAGIEVERGDSTNVALRWNESTDQWETTENGSTFHSIINTESLEDRLAQEHWHKPARLATNAVLPNSPTYTAGTLDEDGGFGIGAKLESSTNAVLVVDSTNAAQYDRILVKNQADAKQNGVYEVTQAGGIGSHWILIRANDMDGSSNAQITQGETIAVAAGSINVFQVFSTSSFGSGTGAAHVLGTDNIDYTQVSGVAQINFGSGLTVSQNTVTQSLVNTSASTSGTASAFVNGLIVDEFGRLTGYNTAGVQIPLGTSTSGDYVQSLVAGTGVTLSNNSGESATPTIAIGQDVSISASVDFQRVYAPQIVGTVIDAVEFVGPLTGNASTATKLFSTVNIAGQQFDGSASIAISPTDLTGVTASAAELNILDGVTASTAEINILDGVTASYTELNILDGVTASTAELNILDGVTASFSELNILDGATLSTTELNYVDGVTSSIQAQLDNKASSTASPVITLSGDLSGSATLTNLGNATLTATIASNSVELGTDTTGNYMSDLTQGTGVSITHTPGEGSNATIAIGQAVGISASVTFANITATGTVTLASDPSSALQAATKQYVDNIATGVHFHEAVVAATTGNLAGTYANGTAGVGATLTKASNGAIGAIDGVTVAVGNRVLVKSQTDAKQNGIYTITTVGDAGTPWVITRATDADNSLTGEMLYGDFCFVMGGSTNAGYGYINNSTANPIVIGTDDITYSAFNAAQTITAGTGLDLTSNVMSLNATLDNLSDVFASAPTDGNLLKYVSASSGWIPAAVPTINALDDIGNVSVPSPTSGDFLKYNGSAWVNQSGVVTTSDTGTVTSTMIADGTIVNGDISDTAAIDLGKIADVSTNAQTASYTLVLADKNKIVEMGVGSANTLTVPLNSSVAFPVGSQINILQTGSGQTTITATGGVTINATPGLKIRAQWSYATLIKRATDTWVLVGDISA